MSPAWAERLAFAVSRLGLSPAAFWALSLAEWRALTAPAPGAAPPSRAELNTLLAAHGAALQPGGGDDR